jgi:hypothetical protein
MWVRVRTRTGAAGWLLAAPCSPYSSRSAIARNHRPQRGRRSNRHALLGAF